MLRIFASFAVATIAIGMFASHADAKGGAWTAQPFFRNQGMRPNTDSSPTYRRRDDDQDATIARARRLEAARQEAARDAAREAAARRARLLEQQRQEAARDIPDKKVISVPQAASATTDEAAAAKRGDRLPSAAASESAATAVTTTTATTTTASTTTTATTSPATSDTTAKQSEASTCRKYSAAADSMVDTPCN